MGNKTNRDVFSRVVDDCTQTDMPLLKQLGSGQGYGSKGEDWSLWPDDLKIRQMPKLTK